jgi:hypothetical protein
LRAAPRKTGRPFGARLGEDRDALAAADRAADEEPGDAADARAQSVVRELAPGPAFADRERDAVARCLGAVLEDAMDAASDPGHAAQASTAGT